jgi:hypothetical protein
MKKKVLLLTEITGPILPFIDVVFRVFRQREEMKTYSIIPSVSCKLIRRRGVDLIAFKYKELSLCGNQFAHSLMLCSTTRQECFGVHFLSDLVTRFATSGRNLDRDTSRSSTGLARTRVA